MNERLTDEANGIRVREALRNRKCVWSGDAISKGTHVLEFQTKYGRMYVNSSAAINHATELRRVLMNIAQERTINGESFGLTKQLTHTAADSKTSPCVACWTPLDEGEEGLSIPTTNASVDCVWIHQRCCADAAEAIGSLWSHEDAVDILCDVL